MAQYFVDQYDGNDAHPGRSRDNAFKTIAKALTVLEEGDVLRVERGLFPPFEVTQNHVVLLADPAVTIAAGGAEAGIRIKGHDVTIQGFRVTNSSGAGITIYETHHVQVIGNKVHGSARAGIYSWRSDYVNVFRNTCAFNRTGISIHVPKEYDGFENVPYRIRVEYNNVFDNHDPGSTEGWGIIIDEPVMWRPEQLERGWEAYRRPIRVAFNEAHDNGKAGVCLFHSDNVSLVHNSVWDNGREVNTPRNFEVVSRNSHNATINANVVVSPYGAADTDHTFFLVNSHNHVFTGNTTYMRAAPNKIGLYLNIECTNIQWQNSSNSYANPVALDLL